MRKVEWAIVGVVFVGGAGILLAAFWGLHALVRWAGVAIMRHVFHAHALGSFSEAAWWIVSVAVVLVLMVGSSIFTSQKDVMSGGGGGWGGPFLAGGGPTAVWVSKQAGSEKTSAASPAKAAAGVPEGPAASAPPTPPAPVAGKAGGAQRVWTLHEPPPKPAKVLHEPPPQPPPAPAAFAPEPPAPTQVPEGFTGFFSGDAFQNLQGPEGPASAAAAPSAPPSAEPAVGERGAARSDALMGESVFFGEESASLLDSIVGESRTLSPDSESSWELKAEEPFTVKPPIEFREETSAESERERAGRAALEQASLEEAPKATEAEQGRLEQARRKASRKHKLERVRRPGKAAEEEPEPAEYVNFKILDATDSDQRPLELHEGLYAGLQYKLVVAMGMLADLRFAAGQQDKTERPPGEKVVLDVVVALEQNFEIPSERWDTLEWPESGPSIKNAEFVLRPVAEVPAHVKVLIYYQHDLLFSSDIKFAVRSEGDEWPPGERPITWKALDEGAVGALSLFRNFRDLDREGRRGINISVHRRTPESYELLFFLRSSGPVARAYPLRVEISEREIAGYLARTRSGLRLLTNAYEHPEADLYSVDQFLDDMGLIGNELWNKLFGSANGQRLAAMLNEELNRPGQIVQVWIENEALDFVFPWPWLYPQPVIAGKHQEIDVAQFWGYRFVVEQLRQIAIGKRPANTVMGEPLRIAGALHNFPAAAVERAFFTERSAKYPARLAWSEVKPAEWRAFLPKSDAHLLYFYCHGHTEQPLDPVDLNNLRTLQSLIKVSPQQAAQWVESLTAEMRRRVRGQSVIAIEKEILNMTDLGQFQSGDPNLNPVVFLNMCESSEFYPGATDNLVDVFLRRGARGVIGTEVPVLAAFGDTFARGFFEAFFAAGATGEGNEIGTVLWQLRRRFLDEGNPLAFIYTYFGDATTRLKPAIIDAMAAVETKA